LQFGLIHAVSTQAQGPDPIFRTPQPVEELPPELDHVVDEIDIHFPWGSLLRSVAIGDKEVLGGLRRIAAPGAWLEIILGIDESRDAAEVARLELPPLTEEYIRSTLMPRYEMAGSKVEESGLSSHAEWPHIETTWAKRLRDNNRRQLLFIIARATS
jgi:16S rRNA (adenine(1408)-N(1))-methyltransferase